MPPFRSLNAGVVRLKVLAIYLGPLLLLYLLYFFSMQFYFYPKANPRVARALASFDHARLYRYKFVDYLILGDSTSLYGIIPKALTPNSSSFSMIASSLYSTSKILDQATSIKVNKGIILTQTFIRDHYDQDVWGLFVPTNLYTYNETLSLLCDQSQCKWNEALLINLKYALARAYLSDMSTGYFREQIDYLNLRYDKLYDRFLNVLKENNGHYVRRGTLLSSREMFLLPYFKHFSGPMPSIPSSESRSLTNLIKFAREQKVKIYYVIMPTAAGAMGVSTAVYRQSVKSYLSQFSGPHFEIVDTSDFESQLTLNDFWDFSHLNSYGARKFTHYLNAKIKQTDQRQHYTNISIAD